MHLNIIYEQNKEKRFAGGISSYAIAGNRDSHNPTAVIRIWRTKQKKGDSESSIKADADINKKSAGQKLDQDNFCYRGDDCKQANQGQQVVDRDNEAAGFNEQSKSLQQQQNQPNTSMQNIWFPQMAGYVSARLQIPKTKVSHPFTL